MSILATLIMCACMCASVFCNSANIQERSCLWELDRQVCAMPLAFWKSGGRNGSDCTVGMSMVIKVVKPMDQCYRLNLRDIFAFYNARGMKELDFDRQRLPYSSKVNTLDFYDVKITTRQLVQRLSIPENGVVNFHYDPKYLDTTCTVRRRCFPKLNPWSLVDTLTLEFKLDHEPLVHFEVLQKPKYGHNTMNVASLFNGTSKNPVVLRMNSSVGDLVVAADVLDNDVFHANTDVFEYSAISKLNVNISAVVQFSENSHEGASLAASHSVERKLAKRSGDCKLIDWCEEELNKSAISINHARVQYRLNMTRLESAVQELYVQSRLSLSYARVTVTIHVVAASGTSNPQTTSGTLTLAVVIPHRLHAPDSATTCSCLTERICKKYKNKYFE